MFSGLLAAAMLFCFLFICLFVFLGGGAEVTQIGRECGVLLVYLTKGINGTDIWVQFRDCN